MCSSFDHSDHHQAISQKLKQAGTYSAKSSYKLPILHYMYQPVFVKWTDDGHYDRN